MKKHPDMKNRHACYVVLGISFAVGACCLLALPILGLRRIGMPGDAFLSGGTTAGLSCMVALFFPAIALGFLGAEALICHVPMLRQFFRFDAARYKPAAFGKIRKEMLNVARLMLAVAYPLALLGGMTYFAATPSEIAYRGWLSLTPDHYTWQQVKEIESYCYANLRGTAARFHLVLDDGTTIDLGAESRRDFIAAYPALAKHLKGVPFHVLPPRVLPWSEPAECPASLKRYFEAAP